MKRSIYSLAFCFIAAATAFGQALSGRYQATLDIGPGNRQTLLIIVTGDAAPISGSIGPDQQHRIFFSGATLHENAISFTAAGIDTTLTIRGTDLNGFASPHGAPVKWPIAGKRIGDLALEDRFPPLPNENASARSQKILALQAILQRGGQNAEDAFWSEIRTSGSPLVETIPGEPNRSLVTFLWQGSEATKNVMLERGRFTRFFPQENLFAHIERTHIWFKTLALPSASRFQYALSENDPTATFPPQQLPRHEQYDPLNPRHLPEDPNSPKDAWHSLLELPEAPPQPWYVKHVDVPKYKETDISMQSRILDEKRDLKIYLPPGYENATASYPTLYLFDGEDENGLVFATWTLENLTAEHKIPPIVVVRIVNPSPSVREKELGCMAPFADFLSNELVPFIRSHYRVETAPDRTGVGGYSRGGLAAAFAALRHPDAFGLALVQSGAFWWEPSERADIYLEPNWLATQYVNHPYERLKFYLEAGLFEVDLQGGGGDILETTRTLRDVLQAKGDPVAYHEFAGDHDYINWRGTFADGLIALFGSIPSGKD